MLRPGTPADSGPGGHGTPGERIATELVGHLDPLPFSRRGRALSVRARELPEGTYAATHAALRRGDPPRRVLALQFAVARRDLDAVAAALADPAVRRRALAATIRLPVPDSVLREFVLDAAPADRRAVYGVLRRSRRSALADELLAEMHRRHGRADTAALLPACSAAVAERWVRVRGQDTATLLRLVRTAADAVVTAVPGMLAARLPGRPLPAEHRTLLALLAPRRPAAVLAALAADQAHNDVLHIPGVLPALLTEPEALLREFGGRRMLNGHCPVTLPPRARRAIATLAAPEVARLGLLFDQGSIRAALLAARPDGERRRIVELAYGETLTADLSAAELRTLPRADRTELAGRILARPDVHEQSWRRLAITATLPFAEAEEFLREATSSHRYRQRTVAWEEMLRCAALDGAPETFPRAVAGAGRAWHDQDMVRGAALRAISEAPRALLATLPPESLGEIVAACTTARDTRRTTLRTLADLLATVLRVRAARGVVEQTDRLRSLLARVWSDRRTAASGPPAVHPPAGWTAGEIWRLRRARVLREAAGGRYAEALRLGGLLGRTLGDVPELDDLVGRIACAATTSTEDRVEAAAAWIAPPGTRESRAAELVAADPSLGALDAVWPVVATRRTDLLDSVLDARTALPPIAEGRRGRWTETQRSRAAEQARSVAGDPDAELPERAAAAALVRDPAVLSDLARSAPQPVAAAALGALARRAPSDMSLPILLAHADAPSGATARAAVRSLGTVLANLPGTEATERLRAVLNSPRAGVGAAKEAARLIAALRPPGAMEVLTEAFRSVSHRDVRAAVAAAATAFAGDDDRVPALLDEALRGPAAVRAAVLAVRPAAYQRPVLARAVAAAMDDQDAEVAGDAVIAYRDRWPDAPGAAAGLVRHILGNSDSHRSRTAAATYVQIARGTGDPGPVVAVAAELGRTASTGESGPARRLRELTSVISTDHGVPDDVVAETTMLRAVADACRSCGLNAAAVPPLWRIATLSLSGLPADPVETGAWDELVAAIDERPYRFAATHPVAPRGVESSTLLSVADHLLALPGSVPGLLASRLLGVFAGPANRDGWSADLRARLVLVRAHHDPDVRESANEVRFSGAAYRPLP
ncbi:hypothetical protein CFN78_19215 [Amycolatopsis antarctica]|uniref:Uncharacterized protein n=1 Tax=Amycolatopsis antarctica TaxID=1854586 RepID=A0A263CZW8_9PSEU|nr:hypothetical protein CFN78_19215 [Amycolatopsis antarctica]